MHSALTYDAINLISHVCDTRKFVMAILHRKQGLSCDKAVIILTPPFFVSDIFISHALTNGGFIYLLISTDLSSKFVRIIKALYTKVPSCVKVTNC